MALSSASRCLFRQKVKPLWTISNKSHQRTKWNRPNNNQAIPFRIFWIIPPNKNRKVRTSTNLVEWTQMKKTLPSHPQMHRCRRHIIWRAKRLWENHISISKMGHFKFKMNLMTRIWSQLWWRMRMVSRIDACLHWVQPSTSAVSQRWVVMGRQRQIIELKFKIRGHLDFKVEWTTASTTSKSRSRRWMSTRKILEEIRIRWAKPNSKAQRKREV